MSKVVRSNGVANGVSESRIKEKNVVIQQPVPVLKQKRKFANKASKPTVRFNVKQKIKDENGNIVEQPVSWMTRPSIVLDAPIGLEYLKLLDFLLIDTSIASLVSKNRYVIKGEKSNQDLKIPDAKGTWNCNLNYKFSNTLGEKVYGAFEDTSESEKHSLVRVLDMNEKEVMHIMLENKNCACCWCAGVCTSCTHQVIIQAPPGNPIGKIIQSSSCWNPKHQIFDEKDTIIAEIIGPKMMLNKNNNFVIKMKDPSIENGELYFNTAIPIINSEKSATYGIKFPNGIDVKVKAIFIGAYFMIDYVFYDNNITIKSDKL